MLKNILKGLMLCSLLVTFTAQAKVGKMMWYMHPNQRIANSISAVSDALSAQCVTDIKNGKVIFNINGKENILTPEHNTVSIPQIKGIPLPNGKFSYSYSILWSAPSKQFGIFSMSCIGDNHRSN